MFEMEIFHVCTYGCFRVDLVLEDDDYFRLWVGPQSAFHNGGCILVGAEHHERVVRAVGKEDVDTQVGCRCLMLGTFFNAESG